MLSDYKQLTHDGVTRIAKILAPALRVPFYGSGESVFFAIFDHALIDTSYG